MPTTRKTLLARVRDPRDAEAWAQFYGLYSPLLYRYARAQGLGEHDAEEIRDQCLALVAGKMTAFEYDPRRGGFRGWLHRIASGRVVDLLRRRREAERASEREVPLVDPNPTPDEVWDHAWRDEHLRYCLEQARDAVTPRNYRAFQLMLLDGYSVEQVCATLDMNPNQVYKAKHRVLKRVRERLARVGIEDFTGRA